MTPCDAGVAWRDGVTRLNQDGCSLFWLQFGEHALEHGLQARMNADDDPRLLSEQRDDVAGEAGNLGGTVPYAQGGEAGIERGQDQPGQAHACHLDRIAQVRIGQAQASEQAGRHCVALGIASGGGFGTTLTQPVLASGSTGLIKQCRCDRRRRGLRGGIRRFLLVEYNHAVQRGRVVEVAGEQRQGNVAKGGSSECHGLVHHLLVLAFADLDLALGGHLFGLGNDARLRLVDFAQLYGTERLDLLA